MKRPQSPYRTIADYQKSTDMEIVKADKRQLALRHDRRFIESFYSRTPRKNGSCPPPSELLLTPRFVLRAAERTPEEKSESSDDGRKPSPPKLQPESPPKTHSPRKRESVPEQETWHAHCAPSVQVLARRLDDQHKALLCFVSDVFYAAYGTLSASPNVGEDLSYPFRVDRGVAELFNGPELVQQWLTESGLQYIGSTIESTDVPQLPVFVAATAPDQDAPEEGTATAATAAEDEELCFAIVVPRRNGISFTLQGMERKAKAWLARHCDSRVRELMDDAGIAHPAP